MYQVIPLSIQSIRLYLVANTVIGDLADAMGRHRRGGKQAPRVGQREVFCRGVVGQTMGKDDWRLVRGKAVLGIWGNMVPLGSSHTWRLSAET